MTTPCVYGFLAAFIFRLSSCVCHPEAVQDGPVLTRITSPVAHSEGPFWDPVDSVLYYVDISGQTLHRYDPSTKSNKHLVFDQPVALVVPIKDQKNKFVVALGRDLVVLTWHWDTGIHSTSIIVTVDEESPKNRFNDGKADARGRMWAGTMGFEEPVGKVQENKATLYRIDNDPKVPCQADVEVRPVSISNGMAWRDDNKVFYYIDTPSRKIDAFDFDLEKGQISNRTTAFEFGDVAGNPDGMTIDADGNLWIACWGGSQVIQVDPVKGRLLRQIKMPVTRVTSVAWGGPRLETLYVSSMRAGLSKAELEEQPYAGSVWEITNLKTIGTLAYNAIVNCKCNK